MLPFQWTAEGLWTFLAQGLEGSGAAAAAAAAGTVVAVAVDLGEMVPCAVLVVAGLVAAVEYLCMIAAGVSMPKPDVTACALALERMIDSPAYLVVA